jgi:L-threonylcarbamoyladenylate synthase
MSRLQAGRLKPDSRFSCNVVSAHSETIVTTSPIEAAAICRSGEPVAFPTETVYGIGAPISDESAIRRIYEIKGRPSDNPLIAHLAESSALWKLATDVPPYVGDLLDRFAPGPITFVLKRAENVPSHAFTGLDTIAVRIPDLDVAREFISAVGEPVVAPSANRSGRPSPTRWQDVMADLGGLCRCILQGEPSAMGLESTVLDCTGDAPLILRPGSVTIEAIQEVVPSAAATPEARLLARSPGTRYRHYAPEAHVTLVDEPPASPPPGSAFIGPTPPDASSEWSLVYTPVNTADYAANLFRFLRDADKHGVAQIFCERVPRSGLGTAIMDRLERAAAG